MGECGYWCWCGLSQCEYLCESLILSVHIYVCAVCTHTFNCTQMVVWFYIQNCVTCTPTGFSVCSCMLASVQACCFIF